MKVVSYNEYVPSPAPGPLIVTWLGSKPIEVNRAHHQGRRYGGHLGLEPPHRGGLPPLGAFRKLCQNFILNSVNDDLNALELLQ